MPISLQWLDQPSDQDKIDLEKLYNDAPKDWLSESSDKSAQWAQTQVNKGHKVALGRFNDRILCGAVLMAQSESGAHAYQFQVDKLCVRKITRQRGVAKQLLVRLCQWANDCAAALYIEDVDGGLAGLYELGFVQYQQGWRYLPH